MGPCGPQAGPDKEHGGGECPRCVGMIKVKSNTQRSRLDPKRITFEQKHRNNAFPIPRSGLGGAQSGLGPSPGWGPVRVGALSGLGPFPGWGPYGPIWAHMGPYGPLWALMGPYGPLWAHKGPILLEKLIILMKNHKIINKNIKIVNLEILKVKTWFWNKDLSSLDLIN